MPRQTITIPIDGRVTDRRVRQLVDEGIFERAERGRYPLAANVQAYLATCEGASESDELRKERIGLLRAQRRKIELENLVREGSKANLDWQDAAISTFAIRWIIGLRPVASWLYDELNKDPDYSDRAIEIAGAVQQWLIGLRAEIEREIKDAAAEARRRGVVIRDYDDLTRMMGLDPEGED